MDFFGILSMVGGLALFLYGMHLLGEGLSSVSGGRLEKILERMTNNPIKAVALGAGVTALIQSSSATTVMVVGFVNSGIMKLSQAVGIIMGANIGTTVTSWILSLSGIESSNFFIQLLKPTSFSPVLALVGVCMLLFSKKEKKHNIGTILIGFAVLMYGMDAMSEAVKPLADVPAFTGMLTKFSNPVLGLLAGTILTAVIQSSSASVGILQALCKTGAVSYATAIPIIMGQNIGTCITAILSAIGAKKNAKRAATIHLMFNMIGTVLFLTVFYTLNLFVHFAFLGENAASDLISRLQLADCQPDLLHGLLPAALNQCLSQLVQLVLRLLLLGGGQKHLGFDQHQVGGHGNELTGNLHIQPLHFVQISQILLQNRRNGHVLNFYFILAQQQKNHVQRTLKVLHGFIPGVNDALQPVLGFRHRQIPFLPTGEKPVFPAGYKLLRIFWYYTIFFPALQGRIKKLTFCLKTIAFSDSL